jgi:hypothetical protein
MLDYGKKSKFKLKIGYGGLEENAANIDASVLKSIPGTLRKIMIFSAEYFWAVLTFMGLCLTWCSMSLVTSEIVDPLTPGEARTIAMNRKRYFIHTFTVF